MDRTVQKRAMWDRLEAEKNALKAEFGGRVDRLYDSFKLEVERVYGHEDIAPFVPRSPSPLTTIPNQLSLLNSIPHHQDNVDTTSNIHHHHDIFVHIETNVSVPFDSPNLSHSTDEPDNSTQPNLVSLGSLAQNGTEMQQQIKREHFDHHGQQQMDNEDPQTNAHNVTVNIKIESMDCDFEIVKQEIKEEYDEDDHDDDDCDGCVRCLVKTEEMSDDDDDEVDNEVGNEGGPIRGGHNDELDHDVDDNDEQYEVIQPNLENGQLLCQSNQSRDDSQNVASNENESFEEGDANLAGEVANTANKPIHQTQSERDLFLPSTSTGQGSNQQAAEAANVSTQTNADNNKRKQPTSNQTVIKRSRNQMVEDGEGEEEGDIADEDREESSMVKVLHLNCTESNCTVQLESMDQLNDHLRTVHRLGPFKCFARNCTARFDKSAQMTVHLQLCHTRYSRLVCAVCQKEYDSQHQANTHWYHYHLTGQFQCKLASDCAQVTSTRVKMAPHLRTHVVVPAKPLNQSNDFHCDYPGCSASFTRKAYLKQHQLTHLNSQSFHCGFPQCNHRTNLRDSLLRHIRKRHFGLPATVKEQREMNIPNIYIDGREPSEYVQLVVDTE